jgi:predicted nucleic acid binding AN1-type Zn finger protein
MSSEKQICYFCGRDVDIPFRCNYCNLIFCSEHRLPESHNCINMPKSDWATYRKIQQARLQTTKKSNWKKYATIIGAIVIVGSLLVYYFLYL